MSPTCAGSNIYAIDDKGDSPFRPATHGEMYWEKRHYNLDVYRCSVGPAALRDSAATAKGNA